MVSVNTAIEIIKPDDSRYLIEKIFEMFVNSIIMIKEIIKFFNIKICKELFTIVPRAGCFEKFCKSQEKKVSPALLKFHAAGLQLH